LPEEEMTSTRSTKPVGAPKPKFHQFSLDFSKLLTDDYPHKKFLTVKYAGKGSSFIVNGKGTLDFKVGADKREQPTTSSEVKLITNIDGRNLEARFDNKGLIRLWGNFGTYTIGKPFEITAKIKTKSELNFLSGNLALEYKGGKANVHTRIDLKDGNIPFFNSKSIFTVDRFQFGYVAKLNLLAYTVARYNLFAAYKEKDFSVYAEHFSKSKTKFELGKLILAAVYKRADNNYVVKASYRPSKPEQFRFKLATVYNVNKDTVIRAKINNNTKLSLATKFKYNNNFTLFAGTQINILEPKSFFTNKTIPIPIGLQFDFSYD
jgi:hypothetical protein